AMPVDNTSATAPGIYPGPVFTNDALYEVVPTGLDQAGESLTVTIDTTLILPGGEFSFSQAFNTDEETTFNDFVTTHRDDILDLLDDGADNGSNGTGTGDDVYVTDGR